MKKKNKPIVHIVSYEKELPLIRITERNPDGVTLNEVCVTGKSLAECEKYVKKVRREIR